MWVYQEEQGRPEVAPPQEILDKPVSPASSESGGEATLPQRPAIHVAEKTPHRAAAERKPFRASRDCLLLAAAYLFGTLLAGVLQALCDAEEADMLSYYLNCWRTLFTVTDTGQLASLFCAEFLTVTGALTVLFFLGMSAIGSVLIFLFAMLYGVGSGLLFSQLLSGLELPFALLYSVAGGLPTAIAAGALCLFGASALQVSSRLHAFSFGRGCTTRFSGVQTLFGQFALTAVTFLPLCGAATALAYFASHFALG